MEKSGETLLEIMRSERNTFESTFVKFVSDRKNHKKYAFCFYEGEDGKYYDTRIRQYFNNQLLTYPVGNKKEVLKLLNRIRSSGLYDKSNICMMFFIDRDYDESKACEDVDLFETPCYSIENLYVQKECLSKLLQSEFGMNPIDIDFKNCLEIFENRECEFNNHVLEFNSLIFLRRKQSNCNSNFSFGSVKTSHIVDISLNTVSKADRYEETIKSVKETLNFDPREIEKSKNTLIEKGNYSLDFRGKNQLDFFVAFIKYLKAINREGDYLKNKYNCHIDVTSNRLSELSQYAVTPKCLVDFLTTHQEEFSNIVNI